MALTLPTAPTDSTLTSQTLMTLGQIVVEMERLQCRLGLTLTRLGSLVTMYLVNAGVSNSRLTATTTDKASPYCVFGNSGFANMFDGDTILSASSGTCCILSTFHTFENVTWVAEINLAGGNSLKWYRP